MACSECEAIRKEYLVFRKAVARFGIALDQLEVERQRLANERIARDLCPMSLHDRVGTVESEAA